jgi:hypothetical protein
MTFHARRTKPAKDTTSSGHYKSPRVMVSYPRALFDRIAGEAVRRQIPFSEVVREKLTLAYRSLEKGAA